MHNNRSNSVYRGVAAATFMMAATSMVWADFMLEEVVVTAQKREQNLQDVGITVTALDQEAMSRAGIQDISRIELVTPGVSYGFIGSDAKIAIRGANSNNTFADNSSIAGFFADGVYRPRASQQSQAYFDVARLEILKGPQGTLYGRNTFAGAINLHTNAPDTEAVGGGVDVTVARFNKVRTEGYVNAPISDTFALRFAGVLETSDGWIRNSGSGGRLGVDDDANFRISALWLPTDNVEVIARYTSISEKGTTPGIFAAEGLCRPVAANGLTDVFGRSVDCQNPSPGAAGVDSLFNNPNEVNYDVSNDRDNSEDNVTLEVNWELGSVALKSISSYTDFESALAFDGDFSGNPGYPYYWDDAAESYTQELQLSSAGDGAFKWTTGLYYSVDEIAFGFSQFRTASYAPRTATAADLNGVEFELQSATALIDPFGRDDFSDFADFQEIETTTQGVFFQGEVSVTDTLRLIAGIRYNKEEKETDTFSGASVPGTGQFGLNARPIDVFVYTLDPERSATRSFEDTTWRAGIEWDANDNILLYANASTGFLSGGVNSDGSAFESQESLAYEAGIKSRWLDDSVQFNAAIYMNEFTNLTTQELIVLSGESITRTVNGGAVDTTGLEIELVWLPTDNLIVNLNASFMDNEYGEFGAANPFQLNNGIDASTPAGGNGFLDLEGETPPWAPELTLSLSAGYDFDLGDNGRLTPFIQLYYSDDYNTDDIVVYSTQVQDSFTKTDFRLIWTSLDEQWTVSAYIENIEDEEVLARTNVGGNDLVQGSYQYPQNYGIKMGYSF